MLYKRKFFFAFIIALFGYGAIYVFSNDPDTNAYLNLRHADSTWRSDRQDALFRMHLAFSDCSKSHLISLRNDANLYEINFQHFVTFFDRYTIEQSVAVKNRDALSDVVLTPKNDLLTKARIATLVEKIAGDSSDEDAKKFFRCVVGGMVLLEEYR